jgi:hypothetical protein
VEDKDTLKDEGIMKAMVEIIKGNKLNDVSNCYYYGKLGTCKKSFIKRSMT